MDNSQEMLELLTKLNKKVDKLTNLVTKIAKTLHLVPVTEKEERELQILQRSNLNLAAKVSAELDEMSPKDEHADDQFVNGLYASAYSNNPFDIFGDVIADDYLTGGV